MAYLSTCIVICCMALGILVVFLGLTAIHRLFFHQLGAFPGPAMAATTSLYKAYFEVFKGGELLQHLVELHAKYGPVVRIAPNELHFNDYAAHLDIYAIGSSFTKDPAFYKCFSAEGSAFGAINPHDSKIRRNLLSPFFSRRAVLKFEIVIQEKVEKLVSRLIEYNQRKPANLFLAFRCTSIDIIASYCFESSIDSINAEDFCDPFIVATQSAIPSIWAMKFLPFVTPVASVLPRWLMDRLASHLLTFANLSRMISAQIDHILDDGLEGPVNPTIYHHLLSASKDGGDVRSRRDLIEEAFSLLQAGSEGPGNVCTVGTFYVLNDPCIHIKLFDELCDAWPDKNTRIGYAVLEKLPYLTAVIRESLRMSHGIVSPLPRIVGPTSANISGYVVPAGVVVGVSVTCLHNDGGVFPEPHIFSPERWMHPPSREMEKHLVPFSRGPRMCLGINLAWCEIYLIFANVFRKLDMDIHDTTVEDFRTFKEFFTPVHQGRNFHAFVKERSI